LFKFLVFDQCRHDGHHCRAVGYPEEKE